MATIHLLLRSLWWPGNWSPCLHFGPSSNLSSPSARGNHSKCNYDGVFLVHKPKWAYKALHDLRLALQPHLPPFLLCVDYSGNVGMFTIAQHTHVSQNSFFYKRELCSCFDHWKLMKPLIACPPALLLPAKMDRNMDPEENQSECLGTSIITPGYSYMNAGQLKESQEKGTLLD